MGALQFSRRPACPVVGLKSNYHVHQYVATESDETWTIRPTVMWFRKTDVTHDRPGWAGSTATAASSAK